MHGHAGSLQQLGKALELEARHRPADVVGVVVGHQHPGQMHSIGLQRVDQIVRGVGRVNDHAIAGLTVPDEVGEIAHLLRDHVAGREVLPREQLPEIQAVGHLIRLCGRRLQSDHAGGAALVQVRHVAARPQEVAE